MDHIYCEGRSEAQAYRQANHEKNFCGIATTGGNACTGDSGGGYFIKKYSKWFLSGIVSGAIAKNGKSLTTGCDNDAIVMFEDVGKFYNWIYEEIEKYEKDLL